MTERGQIYVAGAGNSPPPPELSYIAGTPWAVSVSGADDAQNGASVVAAEMPDLVANFTAHVALSGTIDEYDWNQGTSFSAPVVAATVAGAIGEVRAADAAAGAPARAKVALAHDVRAALNASARLLDPTQYDARGAFAHNGSQFDPMYADNALRLAAPILAPGPQGGWGYVDGSLAHAIAQRVLAHQLDPPPEKAAVAAWMAQYEDARSAYWNTVGQT
jgi:hypothetical protein